MPEAGGTMTRAGEGRTPFRCGALFLLSCLLFFAPRAHANARAPIWINAAPSGALRGAGEGLVVQGETLSLLCGLEMCEVIATYEIEAATAGSAEFDFILPVPRPVEASASGKGEALQVAMSEALSESEAEAMGASKSWHMYRYSQQRDLYRARFNASIGEGRNRIVVRYRQPLSAGEILYGWRGESGSPGRYRHVFQYELWPLREWTIAPGFRLSVSVGLGHPDPSVMESWSRRMGSIYCEMVEAGSRYNEKKNVSLLRVPGSGSGDRIRFEGGWGSDFPDRIFCTIGVD